MGWFFGEQRALGMVSPFHPLAAPEARVL